MKPRWVNLYSVALEDRKGLEPGQFPRNSQYMGRVLLSLHMMRHPPGYRPAFGPTKISRAYEAPEEANYDLRYDYFEIANCKSLEKYKNIKLVTQIGRS
jgi:hypothetical protein